MSGEDIKKKLVQDTTKAKNSVYMLIASMHNMPHTRDKAKTKDDAKKEEAKKKAKNVLPSSSSDDEPDHPEKLKSVKECLQSVANINQCLSEMNKSQNDYMERISSNVQNLEENFSRINQELAATNAKLEKIQELQEEHNIMLNDLSNHNEAHSKSIRNIYHALGTLGNDGDEIAALLRVLRVIAEEREDSYQDKIVLAKLPPAPNFPANVLFDWLNRHLRIYGFEGAARTKSLNGSNSTILLDFGDPRIAASYKKIIKLALKNQKHLPPNLRKISVEEFYKPAHQDQKKLLSNHKKEILEKYNTSFKSYKLHNDKVYMLCDRMEGDLILRKYFSLSIEGLEDSTQSQEGNGFKYDEKTGFLVKHIKRVAPSDPSSNVTNQTEVSDEINKEIFNDYDDSNQNASSPNNSGGSQFQTSNVVDAIH